MNKKNTQYLFKKYKWYYPNLSPRETLMCFGFECKDGWFELIKKLSKDIDKYLKEVQKKHKEYLSEFQVVQVKEKFGGLRFYTGSADMIIFDMIHKAEDESYIICEECGKKGKCRDDLRYVLTLCDKHYRLEIKRIQDTGKRFKQRMEKKKNGIELTPTNV